MASQAGGVEVARTTVRRREAMSDGEMASEQGSMYREYQGRKTDPIAWLTADRSKHQSSKQQMDHVRFALSQDLLLFCRAHTYFGRRLGSIDLMIGLKSVSINNGGPRRQYFTHFFTHGVSLLLCDNQSRSRAAATGRRLGSIALGC